LEGFTYQQQFHRTSKYNTQKNTSQNFNTKNIRYCPTLFADNSAKTFVENICYRIKQIPVCITGGILPYGGTGLFPHLTATHVIIKKFAVNWNENCKRGEVTSHYRYGTVYHDPQHQI
jgi:hypothetical protein